MSFLRVKTGFDSSPVSRGLSSQEVSVNLLNKRGVCDLSPDDSPGECGCLHLRIQTAERPGGGRSSGR